MSKKANITKIDEARIASDPEVYFLVFHKWLGWMHQMEQLLDWMQQFKK